MRRGQQAYHDRRSRQFERATLRPAEHAFDGRRFRGGFEVIRLDAKGNIGIFQPGASDDRDDGETAQVLAVRAPAKQPGDGRC